MPKGLSFRAAAARVGCSHVAIGAAVKNRRIPLLPDGTLAPEAVDHWHANRRARRGGNHRKRAAKLPETTSLPLDQPGGTEQSTDTVAAVAATLAALPSVVLAGGIYADRAAAELARDSYMARLRQLEYEELAGQLVRVDVVRQAITASCVRVRTRLLAIPSEHAPGIARLKDAAAVQGALQHAIVEALDELCIAFGKEAA